MVKLHRKIIKLGLSICFEREEYVCIGSEEVHIRIGTIRIRSSITLSISAEIFYETVKVDKQEENTRLDKKSTTALWSINLRK